LFVNNCFFSYFINFELFSFTSITYFHNLILYYNFIILYIINYEFISNMF
jgi:hypothetical protein